MAGGFYRGQGAQYNIFMRNLSDYLGGLGPGGQYQNLLKSLYQAQRPMLGEAVEKFGHQAAGLGQAVPGQGYSGKAQAGERDLMSKFMADITGQALGTYQMPWSGFFGGTGQIPGQFQSAFEFAKESQAAPWQDLAGLFGGLGGMGCCFIFLEANNGVLDRIARRYRDEYGTPEMKSGYRRLAMWLVPLMRKSRLIKALVRWTMVKPMISWGKSFYGENQWGHIFKLVAFSWLKVFDIIGKQRKYIYLPDYVVGRL